jgi:hypothetical protein
LLIVCSINFYRKNFFFHPSVKFSFDNFNGFIKTEILYLRRFLFLWEGIMFKYLLIVNYLIVVGPFCYFYTMKNGMKRRPLFILSDYFKGLFWLNSTGAFESYLVLNKYKFSFELKKPLVKIFRIPNVLSSTLLFPQINSIFSKWIYIEI